MTSESTALLASDGVPQLPLIVSGVEDAAHTIFMVHGWPDDEREFVCQAEHFGKRYRVAAVRLPWFGTYAQAEADAQRYGHRRAGYTLAQLAKAIVRSVDELGGAPPTCICHDWGAMFALLAELEKPGLFGNMVVLDVSLPRFTVDDRVWSPTLWLGMLMYGVVYQFVLAFGYLLHRASPSLGRRFINSRVLKMCEASFWKRPGVKKALEDGRVADALKEYPSRGDVHPLAGFTYYELHRYVSSRHRDRDRDDPQTLTFRASTFWLRVLRLAPPTIAADKRPAVWHQYPTCPVLFMYGNTAKGGMKFHDPTWEKKVMERDDGSRVVSFDDAGHWLFVEKAEQVNTLIDEWLASQAERAKL